MRCKIGTSRRRAITFSSTDEYVEVRIDSILELLRFTGVALAAIRMGRGGGDDKAVQEPSDVPAGAVDQDDGEDTGAREVPANTEMGGGSHEDADSSSPEDEGFERDVYLSYRSFRIQIA